MDKNKHMEKHSFNRKIKSDVNLHRERIQQE